MKKVILLLLLILPVIIVAVSFAIAGIAGRAVMYVEIENVYITDIDEFFMYKYNGKIAYWYGENNRDDQFILAAEVGGLYEFEKFVTVSPARAEFSKLDFVISNPSAVKIEGGKIHVLQNMRSSDNGNVEIRVEYGGKLFLIIYAEIKADNGTFDYFGFDYNMLSRGIKGRPCENYIEVTADNQIKISRQDTASLGFIIPLGEILNDGFDIAPANLLSYSYAGREDFLNSLKLKSGDDGILRIFKVDRDGRDDYDAELMAAGEVEITVTADYAGAKFELRLILIIS